MKNTNEASEKPEVVLTGEHLTIEDIVAIGVGDKRVALSPQSLDRCRASRNFLEQELKTGKIIYGVNTSFGPMCNKIIRDADIETLQANLIRSHAAGLGDPLPPYIALATLTLRLNALVKGYSGVRIELLELMRDMINAGIAPYIPESGSVGASGDLVHLAHAALAIIGEGQVYRRGQLVSARAALAQAGLHPIALSYKEGLALMNGTSAMTALAAFALFGAEKLLRLAYLNAAFVMEIFGGIDDAFDPHLHALKPHPGQVEAAAIIRRLYQGSANITPRSRIHERINSARDNEQMVYQTNINVQDVYSIRCTAQILAPVVETIAAAIKTVEIEANGVNDNPVIVPDEGLILHGGNFHGQSLSFAMDMLGIAICTLSNLSERRINKLLDKHLNEGLPEHLIAGPAGLVMGFMGAQYLATSSTAETRHLANPMSIHSISCNASNQDVVSMGTIAARKTFRLVRNAKHVLTLETLADLQALALKKTTGLGFGTGRFHAELAPGFSVYDNQRVFHDDLTALRRQLFSSPLLDSLDAFLPPEET
ncbi:MAG TPA: histidine ammonia-lyase [Verrucomicrobia bacterium]|nr:MAG: histidine ammonia-lyase [Lentisphaerae bacterium GWF2_57_35]HBA86368.1 histidine ammonia-lyase [Verrucomicrobiota bacterium]